jgi:site-specific DNA-adenine methylase
VDTRAVITNLDWKETVADLNANDFAYFDPPYATSKVHGYSSGDIDHTEMVAILKNANFRWMLSEYNEPLYLEAFW